MDIKVWLLKLKIELIVILLTIRELPRLYKRLKVGIYITAIQSAYPNWKPNIPKNDPY